MIEVQEIQEVPAAEVVPALHLRDVGGDRVGPLVAIDRIPAVAVAERLKSRGRVELRVAGVALIADALIVGAGNLEDVEPEVAGVEVRTEHFLLLPREAERAVHQQRRAERPRMAGRQLVDLGVAAVSRRIRIRSEVVRQVVDDRVHVAELDPQLMR